jgi:excinuclease ABC subunit C
MSLEEKLKQLPTEAGVYLMKNKSGTVIYVGKAKNLKNRVRSYFKARHDSIKTAALVEEIADFELILCKSEVEALLLERSLIRHNKPHYNILLRDDKEYPFVRIDLNARWPRVEKVRRQKNDGAKYLGPFGNEGQLNQILKIIFRIFPLVRCSQHVFNTAKRPCNYYHMKMCYGPCVYDVDRDLYMTVLHDVIDILEGRNRDLIKKLQTRMAEAAENEQFEQAVIYRDQIEALTNLVEPQTVVLKETEAADIIALVKNDRFASFHVLTVRDKRVIASENFMSNISIDTDADDMISFMLQYYLNRKPPQLVLLNEVSDQYQTAKEVLKMQHTDLNKLSLSVPRGKEQKQLMEMASKNALHALEDKTQEMEKSIATLEILRDALNLNRTPRRIECIDISNLGSTAVVASDVCFVDARPAKELYRHYNIQSLDGRQDDFDSIREVVRRRLERARTDGDLPDLLIIDGGKGQLKAASEIREHYHDLDFALVSLAKSRLESDALGSSLNRSSERIFMLGREEPLEVPEESPIYRIVAGIRDEAHRFAIGFHRKQRSRSMTESVLDNIGGIGPTLKKRLLMHFNGLSGMKQASIEQMTAVKGVSEKLAIKILATLKGEEEEEKEEQQEEQQMSDK